jgi:hypothetical protein
MKTFKIKDLVVSVGDNLMPNIPTQTFCPGGSVCHGGTICPGGSIGCFGNTPIFCPAHSACFGHTGCIGHTFVTCGVFSNPCGISIHTCGVTFHTCGHSFGCGGTIVGCGGTIVAGGGETIRQFEHLSVDELEALKGELTNLQKDVASRLQPQSMEDLVTLETKLNEALTEIKIQKGKIE